MLEVVVTCSWFTPPISQSWSAHQPMCRSTLCGAKFFSLCPWCTSVAIGLACTFVHRSKALKSRACCSLVKVKAFHAVFNLKHALHGIILIWSWILIAWVKFTLGSWKDLKRIEKGHGRTKRLSQTNTYSCYRSHSATQLRSPFQRAASIAADVSSSTSFHQRGQLTKTYKNWSFWKGQLDF